LDKADKKLKVEDKPNNHEKQKEDDNLKLPHFEKDEKKTICNSQPSIKNSSAYKMSACAGTLTGETCLVVCDRNFIPTKDQVKCVPNGDGTDPVWD